jgi:hypothetical protein
MQWRNEIASHTDGLKVLVWHGSSRESDVAELKKFDVVSIKTFIRLLRKLLTTSGIVYRS